MRELRAYAWAEFMAAAIMRAGDITAAANFADLSLAEWDKRFGTCAACVGTGRVITPGDIVRDCSRCDGTGREPNL